jgi:Protein of unknown function (DUF3551)
MMRGGIMVAATLAVLATTSMLAATTNARADDEWCGYAIKDKAIIECGYSSVQECQNVVGNGGMCFVDPDYAFNERRATPLISQRASTLRG